MPRAVLFFGSRYFCVKEQGDMFRAWNKCQAYMMLEHEPLYFVFIGIVSGAMMSNGYREAESMLGDIRAQVQDEVNEVIRRATQDMESRIPNKAPDFSKSGSGKVDKLLLEALTKEIEVQVVPLVEDILAKTERLVSSKMAQVEKELFPADSKLRIIEERFAQLSELLLKAAQPASPCNPYVEIEEAARLGDWDTAWRRAVQVRNGIDFVVHLISPKSSMEDFLTSHPVLEALVALQICINACKEMLESPADKAISTKLELVSELVLNITNPGRVNVTHQFGQLKELLLLLAARLGPAGNKVREILKIVVATERLLTPAVSLESTPARYSPALMYP
jgi:hypothetical protein